MKETSKALQRRGLEDRAGTFPWTSKIFVGKGIDVGCGNDPLPFHDCISFDLEQGDANKLDEHFDKDTFDYLHSSQSLEHMEGPGRALQSWINVVKPGGSLVITVPDWCLYEKMIWPSRFNPDHKSSWSLWLKGSYANQHVHLPEFLRHFDSQVSIPRLKLVDTNYNYTLPPDVDQTLGNAEAFIEFVLIKNEENKTTVS